ncbi:MAG: DUF4129 domain-containing protein [Lachnospiraceae bacterium]|nr:DUF4129 domain-containing protein [Lachnospiraceae bacterium]
MLTLVLLKYLSDLGFYYAFAGFLALLAGAEAPFLLASLGLQALTGTLTFPLRERGSLRFLPLALLAGIFFLPGGGWTGWLAALPPVVYMIYLTARKLYLPDWSAQVDLFQVFWKVLLGFCVLALLVGCGAQLAAITIPAGLISLICCVVLLRSLRHDLSVCCTPRFQVMNLAAAAGVILAAVLFSSDVFLRGVRMFFAGVYQTVVYPLLLGCVYILAGVLRAVVWLFSRISFSASGQQESEVTIDTSGLENVFEGMEAGQNADLFLRVLTVLGLILAVGLLIFFFRWLSGHGRRDAVRTDSVEQRSAVSEKEPLRRRFRASSRPVGQVRAQYRKYLNLCRRRGIELEKSDTSEEIERKTKYVMESEDVRSLRRLYIAARYNDEATKEDVAEARRLYERLAASVKG